MLYLFFFYRDVCIIGIQNVAREYLYHCIAGVIQEKDLSAVTKRLIMLVVKATCTADVSIHRDFLRKLAAQVYIGVCPSGTL